jgi:hypothetical protein
MAAFLLLGAAWAFFQGKDGTASVAAFSAGLVLLGAWLATAVVDWSEGSPQRAQEDPPGLEALSGEPDDPDA